MERELLARTRFYNGSQDLDELLQRRYSKTGEQKNFIILKPTGSNVEEKTQNIAHAINEGVKKESDFLGTNNRVGKVSKKVDWTKKVTKHAQRKQQVILDKKSHTTTRLAFRKYVKEVLKRQKSLVKETQRRINEKNEPLQQVLQSMRKQITKQSIPQYDDYIQLNRIWEQYIVTLVNENGSVLESNVQQLLTKLSAAEYIGSIVRITDSKDDNLVNLVGIILYEFKNFFVFVIPEKLKFGRGVTLEQQSEYLNCEDMTVFSAKELIGGMRLVEKKSCIFKILVPCKNLASGKKVSQTGSELSMVSEDYLEFLIIGARFNYRTAERSSKKFKSQPVDDLNSFNL